MSHQCNTNVLCNQLSLEIDIYYAHKNFRLLLKLFFTSVNFKAGNVIENKEFQHCV